MTDYRGQRFGNYQLVSLLGKGGYAQVYLGEQIFLKTLAAIKILDDSLEETKVEQFRLEAGTIARLEHPHIVRLLDYGVENTTPYLIMDYAPNGTLRQRHPQGTPIPLSIAIRYVQQVAAALDYAHRHKIIHRDVKPENLLLGRNGDVLLSDFGIAVVAHQTQSMTTQDEVGTISYMAPEQLRRKPHPASDQYALAVTVYEWLTGNLPFQGSPIEIAMQHLQIPPPSMREPGNPISAEVERVVLKALEKHWRMRFASVREFALALQEAHDPRPPFVRVPGRDVFLVSPEQVDPRDFEPTAEPPNTTNALEPIAPKPDAQAELSTWLLERRVGNPTPGDPKGEYPTASTTQSPERTLPSDAQHPRPTRLKRRTALLAIVAVLLIAVLGVGGLQFINGAKPIAQSRGITSTATSQIQATQPGVTPSPGASPIPTRNTSTTPAPAGTTPIPTATGGSSPTATTTPPNLSASPTSLAFFLQIINCLANNQPQWLTIKNVGGGSLSWSASVQNTAYLTIDQSTGTLGPSETSQIKVTATCGITVNKTDKIIFTSNGGNSTVNVTITLS
jgi:serine/threonine protein kinase